MMLYSIFKLGYTGFIAILSLSYLNIVGGAFLAFLIFAFAEMVNNKPAAMGVRTTFLRFFKILS